MSQKALVERLNKRDLEIEKRLAKISLDAVPKRPPSPKAIKYKSRSFFVVDGGTPAAIAEKDFHDLTFEIQSNKIAKNAIVEDVNFAPRVIKSPLTQEMIRAYEVEQAKPVVIGGRKFKYHPSSIALDLEEFVPIPGPTAAQIRNAETEIEDDIREIQVLEENVVDIETRAKVDVARRYDANMGARRDALRRTADPAEIARLEGEMAAIEGGYGPRLAALDRNIADARADIAMYEADLALNRRVIHDANEIRRRNEAEDYRIKNINANKLKSHAEELMMLNSGQFDLARQPDETDEEYKDRILETGQTTYDESALQTVVDLHNAQRAKQNLQELFSDGSRVELILHYLTVPERFEFNKRFTLIKEKFLKEFGFNNTIMTDEDVLEFIRNKIPKTKAEDYVGPISERKLGEFFGTAPGFFGEIDAGGKYEEPATFLTPHKEKAIDIDTGLPTPITISEASKKLLLSSKFSKENYKAVLESLDGEGVYGLESFMHSTKREILEMLIDRGLIKNVVHFKELSERKAAAPTSTFEFPAPPTFLKEPTHSLPPFPKPVPHVPIFSTDYVSIFPPPPMTAPKPAPSKPKPKPPNKPEKKMSIQEYDKTIAEFTTKNFQDAIFELERQGYEGLEPYENGTKEEILDALLERGLIETRMALRLIISKIGVGETKGKGLGAHIKNLPKFCPFGKVYVSLDKLHYNNMLVIRGKTKKPMTGIRNVKVSDAMVAVIFKICEGKHATKGDISMLKPDERILYDNLLYMSGLHKSQDNNIEESAKKMKERLELIEGQIMAGNNNRQILKELHGLLHRMAKSGVISLNNAGDHYKQIKKNYFN